MIIIIVIIIIIIIIIVSVNMFISECRHFMSIPGSYRASMVDIVKHFDSAKKCSIYTVPRRGEVGTALDLL